MYQKSSTKLFLFSRLLLQILSIVFKSMTIFAAVLAHTTPNLNLTSTTKLPIHPRIKINDKVSFYALMIFRDEVIKTDGRLVVGVIIGCCLILVFSDLAFSVFEDIVQSFSDRRERVAAN